MNGEDLRFLAERAETVVGRSDQRLAEVHARIKSARRRRAAAVAAGASAAVVAAAIGIAVLTGPTGSNSDNGPIPPADPPSKTDAPKAATVRQIAYGDGWPIRAIHMGDRTVDISDLVPRGSDTPVYINTTDTGVVFTVDDHESRIRFTDGTDVVPIGQVGSYTHIGSSGIVTGTSGSLAAWPDWSGGSTQLVVYDTARRVELTRIDCPMCGSPEIVGSHVYWARNESVSEEPTTMFDAGSNAVRPASEQSYLDDLANQPRGLLVGDTRTTATPTSGIGLSLSPVDGRLVPLQDHGEDPANEVATKAFDTGSGEELDLRLPDDYHSPQLLNLFEWLDDDRLALVADGDQGTDQGQILVCQISAQQCRLIVPSSPERRWVANFDFP
jgi:hypothetical protein